MAMVILTVLAIFTQPASAHPSTNIGALNPITNLTNKSLPPTSNLTAGPAAFEAWASFCDDLYCSNSCGNWVDISNSDCLKESGRWSVFIKSHGGSTNVGLIYSPTDSCNCQQQCDQFMTEGFYALNYSMAPETFSYRWVNSGHQYDACDGNNC